MKNNDLQIFELLNEFGFSRKAIFDVIDEIGNQYIDFSNARQVLQVLKGIGILEEKNIQKKIAKILAQCEYANLVAIQDTLDASGYNSKAF